jgi:hypothetical protein
MPGFESAPKSEDPYETASSIGFGRGGSGLDERGQFCANNAAAAGAIASFIFRWRNAAAGPRPGER